MTPDNLVLRWTQQLEAFARVNALVDGAKLVNDFLVDLRGLELAKEDPIVTLRAAAKESGYSVEHLARMVRQGKIPNAGRRNAPRIRVADLPVRRSLARDRVGSYNVDTDARTLRNGRQ